MDAPEVSNFIKIGGSEIDNPLVEAAVGLTACALALGVSAAAYKFANEGRLKVQHKWFSFNSSSNDKTS